MADQIIEMGSLDLPGFLEGPSRVQLQNKNKPAWQEFADHFKQHSVLGTAMTLRHVQASRPSLYGFEIELAASTVPTLLLAGDEDEHVLDVNLWLKRIMPYAALSILPKSGHLINLEEPEKFNAQVRDFLWKVEAGNWPRRDPRSQTAPKI
jgi:pimeloyl-ACP methyl ester carboxylesterase